MSRFSLLVSASIQLSNDFCVFVFSVMLNLVSIMVENVKLYKERLKCSGKYRREAEVSDRRNFQRFVQRFGNREPVGNFISGYRKVSPSCVYCCVKSKLLHLHVLIH